jgi:3-isopropylmalate/(R)-2-methylmalate dehydratase small subunit
MTGRAWVYGDSIDTDVLAPGIYFKLTMEEASKHTLEAVDSDFAPNVRKGDIFVAGKNLGLGSAREQAPFALKTLGIDFLLAKSFARIFYRNAFNVGLPALFFPQADEIFMGDQVDVDIRTGKVTNLTTGKFYEVSPIPPHLLAMIEGGGLMPHLKKKLAAS